MSIPGAASPLFLTSAAAAAAGYQIDRSVRLNSGDSAYFGKTFSSAGSTTTWTLSFWIKRSNTSGNQSIFMSYNGSSIAEGDYANIEFNSSGEFVVGYAYAAYKHTNRLFRDFSSWYHIVVRLDTGNSTASDRVQIYVNGVKETSFKNTHDPDSGQSLAWNKAHIHRLGSEYNQRYMNGYLAEVHFVDGTALDADSFGEFDSNNVWQPKDCKDDLTYGTNGFYLNFSDNTSTTTIAEDSSGNNFDWTASNISVTAGVDNDSLLDSPTNGDSSDDTGAGGELSGNYCVINPLGVSSNTPTISDGNLKMVLGAAQGTRHGTMGVTSGKWYFEVVYTAASPLDGMVGVANKNHENNLGNYTGGDADGWGYYYNGEKYNNGGQGAYGASWGVNDVMGIALDMDNGALYFSKNGTYQNSGDPTSGSSKTGAAFTNLSGTIFPCINGYGATQVVNFGQRTFNTSAPSGYKCWNTANLPDPTIADGSTAFDAKLYTGTGSTQTITGINHSPDLVWIKRRSGTTDHNINDIVRGAGKQLASNQNYAEVTNTNNFAAFTSDGFTVGTGSQTNATNPPETHVAWTWDAGTSTVSNTDGSITSSVRASQTNGCSIVSYTGDGNNATIGHGLNAAPEFIIQKRLSQVQDWNVYHSANGKDKSIILNTTAATYSSTTWNNTAPTSSVFSIVAVANPSGQTHIAYCFAPVEGFSAFGSYEGNGNASGPFVFTGFKPRWIIIKNVDNFGTGYDWFIFDTARDTFNVAENTLKANLNSAEADSDSIDILSNGFKIRTTANGLNLNAHTHIYAAFAENPLSLNGGLAR